MAEKIGNVWVFIEQEAGKIADVSLELVCKGRELAAQLGVKTEAVLLGDNVAGCVDTSSPTAATMCSSPRIRGWSLSPCCPMRR